MTDSTQRPCSGCKLWFYLPWGELVVGTNPGFKEGGFKVVGDNPGRQGGNQLFSKNPSEVAQGFPWEEKLSGFYHIFGGKEEGGTKSLGWSSRERKNGLWDHILRPSLEKKMVRRNK